MILIYYTIHIESIHNAHFQTTFKNSKKGFKEEKM